MNGGSLVKTWSKTAGPGTSTFTGDVVDVSVCGEYTFKYTVVNGPCSNDASVTIKFYDTPTVNAGSAADVCGLNYTLLPTSSASCVNGGSLVKTWLQTAGPGTSSFTGDVVDVTVCGEYTFKYTVVNGPCSNDASVTIKFYDTPTVGAGSAADVCGLTYTLLPTSSASCVNGGSLVKTWSQTSGPGTSTFTGDDVVVSVCGEYTFKYTVVNGPCSNDASVTIKFYDTPAVSAGSPADVCGLTYSLLPTSSASCVNGGSLVKTWTKTAGPGTVTFTGDDVVVSECGEYTFKYTVVNGPCSNDASVTIKFYTAPVPSAGGVPNVCGLSTSLTSSYTVACASPTISTAWSKVTGPGSVTFTGNNVVVSVCGEYEFAYTVTNAPCNPVSASVTVKFFDTPTGVDAGVEQDVCGLSTTLAPTLGSVSCDHGTAITGAWSYVSGPDASPVFGAGNAVSVTLCGTYVFKYTVTNGPCSANDDVTIKFYDTPVGTDAGPDAPICGLTYTLTPTLGTVSCNNGSTVTGAWSLYIGAGTATFTGNSVDVSVCGAYTFRYTTTNGPCSQFDDVVINFYDTPVINFDAEPVTVCGYGPASVYASYDANCDAPVQSGTWSYTGPGTATITLNTGTQYNIVVSTCGLYTFTFTAVNGPCTATASFNTEFIEKPVPTITGSLDVFACSTVTYSVNDGRSCGFGGLTHTWSVSGGVFVGGINTGTSVSVIWGSTLGSASIGVTSAVSTDPTCFDSKTETVTIKTPTLSGQVKYWNAFETYMPTPYPTNFYGTFPEDYFYVTLYKENGATDIELETKLVEPRLNEDLVELLSSFEYNVPVADYGCEAQYYLKIWDGGLVYHSLFGGPTPPTVSDTYLGGNYTYTNWGGGNATDALAIQLMVGSATDINAAPYNYAWVGDLVTGPTDYGYYSKSIADVNKSGAITALDALTLNYRSVGLIGSFPSSVSGVQYSPNFKVTGRMVPSLPYTTFPAPFYSTNANDIQFNHSGASYLYFTPAVNHKYTSANLPWTGSNNYINIYYTATGDINSSYVPTSGGFKAEPAMSLTLEGTQAVNAGEVVTIPVRVDRGAEIGAITLGLNYRKDLIEVLGTNYGSDFVNVNAEKGSINIGWFNTQPTNVNADDAIAYITVRVLANIENGTRLFELTANTEFADASANKIEGINLKSTAVFTGKASATELSATNFPNPFSNNTTISYNLPEAGKVLVVITNKLGQVVRTLVNASQEAGVQTIELTNSNLQPGVYQYRITLNGKNADYSVVKSMIVVE